MNIGQGSVLFAAMIFLSACVGAEEIDTNMSEDMTDFTFITQNEEPLSLEDLKGSWWIANLVYTNCKTVCPRTSANMVEIQNKLKKVGLSPQIISFTIDPEHDTPKVLKEYAEEYKVDQKTWDFLSGYDFKSIQEISEKTFKATLEEGANGQKSHSYAFYLINPDATIIKKYNGMSMKDLDILVDDVITVLN